MTEQGGPRFNQIDASMESLLTAFFRELDAAGYQVWFHPHPLTLEAAFMLARYKGGDYYAVLADDAEILAYGMLRGWDEGYAIPSLGIATSPRHTGRGLGRLMMDHLHEVARERGASQVRLTVNKENNVAERLYRKLGYDFEELDDQHLVGRLSL